MTAIVATLLVFVALTASQGPWPTLREELQKHRIDIRGIEDADRRITSYAVASDSEWFAIAYYWYDGTDRLPSELRVRTLDRRSGSWRQAILHEDERKGGSALRISRRQDVIYLDLHVNPSAGELLVLSETLEMKKRLAGWSSLILPDGRVVYQNNMVHFAPAHPSSVSLYDPRTGVDVRLYPAERDPPTDGRWMDRAIVKVEQAGTGVIRISVREQPVRIGQDGRAVPDGAERHVQVTCDLAVAIPTCR